MQLPSDSSWGNAPDGPLQRVPLRLQGPSARGRHSVTSKCRWFSRAEGTTFTHIYPYLPLFSSPVLRGWQIPMSVFLWGWQKLRMVWQTISCAKCWCIGTAIAFGGWGGFTVDAAMTSTKSRLSHWVYHPFKAREIVISWNNPLPSKERAVGTYPMMNPHFVFLFVICCHEHPPFTDMLPPSRWPRNSDTGLGHVKKGAIRALKIFKMQALVGKKHKNYGKKQWNTNIISKYVQGFSIGLGAVVSKPQQRSFFRRGEETCSSLSG